MVVSLSEIKTVYNVCFFTLIRVTKSRLSRRDHISSRFRETAYVRRALRVSVLLKLH
jgi:hypothetical protein